MIRRFRFLLLWLVLALGAGPSTVLGAGGEGFYFVQITDTHLGIRENDQRAKRMVKAVNALPMEILFVVHTGDICDRTVRENPEALARARAILKALKPPVYFLAGNHDIDLFQGPSQSRDAYTARFGPLVYARQTPWAALVFAYTDPLAEGQAMPGLNVLEAVAQALESAGGKPILLFHHRPSVKDFYENRFHPGWPQGLGQQWVSLVNRFPVKAVITGHRHRDELHWLGQVPLYVSGPVAAKYGRQAGFRIYQFNGQGRLSYTAQYLD